MKKEEYTLEHHQFAFSKSLGKQYCVKCGLIVLNNGFSQWANEKGCMNELHPSYKSIKSKFTNKFNF
ncbi:hypothetical protein DQT32_03140 [Salmonella enterica subsp. enterica serovar Braenderup]|nr:hypothetical protein [Salmonella enterica subsp. enterica serovar Braenderup]